MARPLTGGASWQLAVCKTKCRSDVLVLSLIAFAATNHKHAVSDNDIHDKQLWFAWWSSLCTFVYSSSGHACMRFEIPAVQ